MIAGFLWSLWPLAPPQANQPDDGNQVDRCFSATDKTVLVHTTHHIIQGKLGRSLCGECTRVGIAQLVLGVRSTPVIVPIALVSSILYLCLCIYSLGASLAGYKYPLSVHSATVPGTVPGGSGILAFILVLLPQGWDVLKIPSKLKHDSTKKDVWLVSR